MDFSCFDAINARVEWKRKFRAAIDTGFHLDVDKIGRRDSCPLGIWFRGDAKEKFGHLVAFSHCVGAHAIFHHEAGRVAALVNLRRVLEAEEALSPTGAFEIASNRLRSAIYMLSRDAGSDDAAKALAG